MHDKECTELPITLSSLPKEYSKLSPKKNRYNRWGQLQTLAFAFCCCCCWYWRTVRQIVLALMRNCRPKLEAAKILDATPCLHPHSSHKLSTHTPFRPALAYTQCHVGGATFSRHSRSRSCSHRTGSEAVRAQFVLQLCQKCALTRKNNAYFKAVGGVRWALAGGRGTATMEAAAAAELTMPVERRRGAMGQWQCI